MKHTYPGMRVFLGAYFHQDFDLDYADIFEAADCIISENIQSAEFSDFINELRLALKDDENIDEYFFEQLELDTIPCITKEEGVRFLEYFISQYDHIRVRHS